MKKLITLAFIHIFLVSGLKAQYNQLPIPDTVVTTIDPSTGYTNYSLNIHEGFTQILPTGNQTITHGYNQYALLGPTLIMHEGNNIQMNVINQANEATTVHWHGIHLPAVMDGGPHQIIGIGATWKPYWTVMNNAATYWYHAHLMDQTDTLVTMGQAGMIIVKDSQEATLALPRHYGVDDIPVILADRQIDTSGGITSAPLQLVTGENSDYMITNGVINARITLPKQVVRLRILDASTFRPYYLGVTTDSAGGQTSGSGNRPFYVIASDGGLMDSTVKINPGQPFIMAPGERYEILLDLSHDAPGTELWLYALNSNLNSINGAPGRSNPTDALGGTNFPVLKIVVGPTNSTPIMNIPTTLKANNFPNPANATSPKTIKFTYNPSGTTPMFTLNNNPFQMGTIDETVPLGSTEEWTISNTDSNTFRKFISSHVFHIHDIQFHIEKIDSMDSLHNYYQVPVPDYQKGWKDVIMVNYPHRVKFITSFEDYADPIWPFMYHCHMLAHEDNAMMAQFLVVDSFGITHVNTTGALAETAISIYPNPATNRLHIDLEDNTAGIYYITIYDIVGRKKLMLPKPMVSDGLDVSALNPGEYLIKIMDTKGNTGFKKFTKL